MLRARGACLTIVSALLCAGCVVASATPAPPTAALVTATVPTLGPATASSTTITIVTPTASSTAPATSTPLDSATPTATATITAPASATAAATSTATRLPPSTPVPTLPLVPTLPPQATAAPIAIVSFSIAPAQINPGAVVTLTWQVTGAQQAAIYRAELGGQLTDMHKVPISGTLVLMPPAGQRTRVDYVLYASAGGSNVSASVSAVILCPDKYFFANPPALCPSGPGTPVAMAAEHFEHGLMLWLSSQNMIYVLFGDGGSPAWFRVTNTWAQGQPESDPSLTPPAGRFQPIRGFGVVWRGNAVSAGQAVRARLGWATDTEVGLNGSYQCDSADKYTTCFINGPGGIVYELQPEFSAWKVWQGP